MVAERSADWVAGAPTGTRTADVALPVNPALLRVTPPREAELTIAGHVEGLSTLIHAHGRDGVALEVAGGVDGVAFYVRASSPEDAADIGRSMGEQYAQAEVEAFEGRDPAALAPGERALARELSLTEPDYYPLRTAMVKEEGVVTYQLPRGVLVELHNLPPGVQGVCQLGLWRPPRRWGHETEQRLRQLEADERARERGTGGAAGRPGSESVSTDLVAIFARALISAPAFFVFWPIVCAALAAFLWTHAAFTYNPHLLSSSSGDGGGDAGRTIALPTHIHYAALAAAAAVLSPVAGIVRLRMGGGRATPLTPDRLRAKLRTPPAHARLRLMVRGGTADQRQAAMGRLLKAYEGYAFGNGNSFRSTSCDPRRVARVERGGGRYVLSLEEAGSMWFFPPATMDIPGLRRAGSRRILPAHPSLEAGGVQVGVSRVGAHRVPVHLPLAAFVLHMLFIGASGSGKSTLMKLVARLILKMPPDIDLSAYYGHPVRGIHLAVIDPHSELVESIVGALTPAQARDAIFLRFGWGDRSVGINILDAYMGRSDKQIVNTLNNMGSRFWDETWGPRMAMILEHACLLLLAANRKKPRAEQYTLLDVIPLLLNPSFRRRVLNQADDAYHTDYWNEDYDRLDKREQTAQRSPILYKLRSFLTSDVIRRVIGQPETTIDLRAAIASGKHIFIDTGGGAGGGVTEEEGKLLNAVLLGMIVDMVRERGDNFDRQLFVLVDEFHTIPTRWSSIYTGLRKFGAAVGVASQGLAPLELTEPKLKEQTLNNVASILALRTGDDGDGESLSRLLDEAVTFNDLKGLRVREFYLKASDGIEQLPVCSVETDRPGPTSSGVTDMLAVATARAYGLPNDDIDRSQREWNEALHAFLTAELGAEERPNETEDLRGTRTTGERGPSGPRAQAAEVGPSSTGTPGTSVARPAGRDAGRDAGETTRTEARRKRRAERDKERDREAARLATAARDGGDLSDGFDEGD